MKIFIYFVIPVITIIAQAGLHHHMCEMEKRVLLEIHKLKNINSSDTQRSQSHPLMQRYSVDL